MNSALFTLLIDTWQYLDIVKKGFVMKNSFTNYKLYIISTCSALLFNFFITSTAVSSELDDIIKKIKEDYKVQHISNEQFRQIPTDNIVIFDVRKLKEYQVSHIKNAIHLDPKTSPDDFLKQHTDKLKGKTAVFYCSVGKRSSRMLSKLKAKLAETGIHQAYNLEGGAFKWHNDKIDFVKDNKVTRNIHPYNAYWGRLIENKPLIKYQ